MNTLLFVTYIVTLISLFIIGAFLLLKAESKVDWAAAFISLAAGIFGASKIDEMLAFYTIIITYGQ